MKLFRIYQSRDGVPDTYDSAIVAAEDADAARRIHPDGRVWDENGWDYYSWVESPENVSVEMIGEARAYQEQGVILASLIG